MMAMGGKGCISVLSNVVPEIASDMTNKFFAGDLAGAAALQCKVIPLVNCLFSQVNPIPAKAAVAAMGMCRDVLRLPLTPMEEPFRAKLLEEMRKLGIQV
jgi:4-hydroxy-tetrahydrodipicolinate synthase